MTVSQTIQRLERTNAPPLAYDYDQNAPSPHELTIIFCGGYRSDMMGTKAAFLKEECAKHSLNFLRFDYSGHGASGGNFADLTISDWAQDTLDIIERLVPGRMLIVGSSMGGWISLLTALHFQNTDKISGLIGLAAAPDFTEDLFEKRLSPQQQEKLFETGIAYVPNDYSDEPYIFTKEFYEDGKTNLILPRQHNLPHKLHFIQGKEDADVPWQTAEKIKASFNLKDSNITYIIDGDHRLSRPQDLEILWQCVKTLTR